MVQTFFAQGRSRIAQELARHWQWRTAHGQFKTRATLAVLVAWEQRGYLHLPPALITHGPRRSPGALPPALARGTQLSGQLPAYRPLQWELVCSVAQRRQWRALLATHHDRGAPGLVGAHLEYFIHSAGGDLLGALAWQSAVEHLDCRDRLVGVHGQPTVRARFLAHAVNQVRWLLLPTVRVPHLASALLSQGLRVLQRDWPQRYGTPLWWAETFVDRQRFDGAAYRAANWLAIGWTRGYAKARGEFTYHGQPKEVYAYVIEPRLRQLLFADPRQPRLTRPFLLAQCPLDNPQPLARRKTMPTIAASWRPKLPPHWELSAQDLNCVGHELQEFVAQFADTFGRIEPAQLTQLYVQGLLSDTARKNVEAMALELQGPEAVRGLQRLLCDCQWDEPWLRQRHWEVSAATLADPQGVWSIDASEFPKKGEHSVGVAPQYCGALGKTANCQSGVFICYASPKGHTLLDARLYLPRCWFADAYASRRKDCRVPEGLTFQTKPELALALGQALWATGLFPGRWVTCDASFGNNEAFLAQVPATLSYLAEISCTRKVWLKQAPGHPALETDGATVESLVTAKGLLVWRSRRMAEGEKGPLVASFARVRVYVSAERTPESERWLLVRNDPGGKLKYALSNAPETEPFGELIRVSAARWPIERCFEEDKSELGLDHYEHRSWTAWHRHMRLVFLAHLFMVQLQRRYKKSPGADAAPGAGLTGMEPAVSANPIGLRAQMGALSPGPQSSSLPLASQTPAPRTGGLETTGSVAAGLNGDRDHHDLPSTTAAGQQATGPEAMALSPGPGTPAQNRLFTGPDPSSSR
jgi:SRSO17 transposase